MGPSFNSPLLHDWMKKLLNKEVGAAISITGSYFILIIMLLLLATVVVISCCCYYFFTGFTWKV